MRMMRIAICSLSVLAALILVPANPASAVFFHIGSGSIDGSLCIGNDCPATPAFGFDTLRLQENNLRIHFDDTSVAAAFPPNDWRIMINDSANGGASHFSVEDATAGRLVFRVFAGARSNALVVDSQGDIGIGTSTPATDIDIKTGDTPTLRLQQDGTSGFTPQTWDVAGNEAGFFIRDATSGSTLPLRIRTGGAPSSSLDIAADGDIGIGDASPDAALDIRRSGGQVTLEMEDSTSGDRWQFVMDEDGASKPGLSFTRTGTGDRELRVSHNGSLILEAGGACIQIQDTDDAGSTACTALNGTLTCATGTCP